jgi:opacity protein-like surface antigen
MKIFVGLLAAIAVGCLAVPNAALAGSGVRLSGGYGYLAYGQWNSLADFDNTVAFPAHGIVGTAEKIHWAPEFSGEFLHSFSPRTSGGLGLGVIFSKADFRLQDQGEVEHFVHRILAVPITATMYFRFPDRLPFATPYIAAGIAVNYARIHFENGITPAPQDSLLRKADLAGWRVGFQGGAGLEFPVTEKVSIDFGVHGRFAEVGGFAGTAVYYNGGTSDVFLAHLVTGEVTIFEPQRTEFKDRFQEGTVDFSGVSMTLAVKVTL